MLIPESSQFPAAPPTQQVITCQRMLTTNSIGKNKRGRKPLARMPDNKKHIQNLNNQRAFRKRREDYVRALETSANAYESLYIGAKNEIRMLENKIEYLGRLAKAQSQGNNNGVNVSYRESNSYGDIVINGTYNDNRSLSVITPTTIPPFSFNEQRYQQQGSQGDPVFCDDIEKDRSQFPSIGRYYITKKCATTPFSNCNDSSYECCPTLPSSEHSDSQWTSQQHHQERYFPPSPSPITTQHHPHHPLNLKWILDENHNENSGDSV